MPTWEHFGEIANGAQLAGLDAVKLIGMIVKASNTARMHKKNCRQFAQHLKLIGNLLEILRISELKRYRETREPLEQLEDSLRRAYILVNSCQDRSFFYLLAMGWNIVYQFRRAQTEIDQYLKIIPLITLVDNARVRERLEFIDMDKCEYTLDDDDRKVQDVIMKPDPSKEDTVVLKKSLSCSYPNLPFKDAIKKENKKLQLELQRSQAHSDVGQCEVIQRLIEVTEAVAVKSHDANDSPVKASKNVEHSCPVETSNNHHSENFTKSSENVLALRNTFAVTSKQEMVYSRSSHHREEWHYDLLGCCSEPLLCLKTCFCPCGTLSKIATVATNQHISSAEACNDLVAYSLILSCCCYTCCVRRKLRKTFNITGGWFDDFLSHCMCCCCALVQEWREVEIRGIHDMISKLTIRNPDISLQNLNSLYVVTPPCFLYCGGNWEMDASSTTSVSCRVHKFLIVLLKENIQSILYLQSQGRRTQALHLHNTWNPDFSEANRGYYSATDIFDIL